MAVAPADAARTGRTDPGDRRVEFEVVEGVTTIDPETGVETETWGYQVADGDSASSRGLRDPSSVPVSAMFSA